MKSITGPDESFSLNFGDSFGDLEKNGRPAWPQVLRPIPSWPVCKTVCSAENTSSVTNFIAERVDALGSRAATINFAKMHMLQVTVFHIRPGHEGEFAEAAKSIAVGLRESRRQSAVGDLCGALGRSRCRVT